MDVFSSATAIGAAIAAGTLTSREACQTYIDRINLKNGSVFGMMAIRSISDVMRDADTADFRRAAGARLSALDGVPFSMKMVFETQGLRTSTGTSSVDYLPPIDSDIAAKLKQAGCVLIGKSNGPGNPVHTLSPNFTEARNPYNTARATGGSSGGSAVSVAAGFTGFDIGSDAAGSIRIPASWNGVYALKGTHNIISGAGDIWPLTPDRPPFHNYLISYGPLTRSLTDLKTLLEIIAGQTARTPDVRVLAPLSSPPLARLAKLSVIGPYTLSSPVQSAFDLLCNNLATAGVLVTNPSISTADYTTAINVAIYSGVNGEADTVINNYYGTINVTNRPWSVATLPYTGSGGSLPAYLSGAAHSSRLREVVYAAMGDAQAIITPATSLPPTLVGGTESDYSAYMGFTSLFNITGHPVVVLPLGVDGATSIPFGVQLVGRHGYERDLLHLATQVDAYLTGFVAPSL